jgi:hypothetical protein
MTFVIIGLIVICLLPLLYLLRLSFDIRITVRRKTKHSHLKVVRPRKEGIVRSLVIIDEEI